jgi:hypothetical protein
MLDHALPMPLSPHCETAQAPSDSRWKDRPALHQQPWPSILSQQGLLHLHFAPAFFPRTLTWRPESRRSSYQGYRPPRAGHRVNALFADYLIEPRSMKRRAPRGRIRLPHVSLRSHTCTRPYRTVQALQHFITSSDKMLTAKSLRAKGNNPRLRTTTPPTRSVITHRRSAP